MFQIQEQLFCLFQKEYFIEQHQHASPLLLPQWHVFHFQLFFFAPKKTKFTRSSVQINLSQTLQHTHSRTLATLECLKTIFVVLQSTQQYTERKN
jgi:hypothetical protein